MYKAVELTREFRSLNGGITTKRELGPRDAQFAKWEEHYSDRLKELWDVFNSNCSLEQLNPNCNYQEFCKYVFSKSEKCLKI